MAEGDSRIVDSADLNAIASNLAHFLLLSERTRIGVKRVDVVRKVLQGNQAHLRQVVDRANEMLKTSLGYQIKEIPGKRVFILANTMDLGGLEAHLSQDDFAENARGLLCIILALILMNNGESIEEAELWELLLQIDIAHDDKQHPVFGDVEKLVKGNFVKQHYLNYAKKPDNAGEFSWGFRAHQDFRPMELLEFVAKIYGDGKTARDFTVAYKRVIESQLEDSQQNEAMQDAESSAAIDLDATAGPSGEGLRRRQRT